MSAGPDASDRGGEQGNTGRDGGMFAGPISAGERAADRSIASPRAGEFTPLWISLVWLIGTYLLFLAVGDVGSVDNLGELTAFIAVTVTLFAIGYRLRVDRNRKATSAAVQGLQSSRVKRDLGPPEKKPITALVLLSALYYLSYGLIYMNEYGVASLDALLLALRDPGGAYLAKFDVYDAQQAAGRVSAAGQIITLAAVFSAPLVPLLILYRKRLSAFVVLAALLGLAAYAAFFLAIGTLSGLGGILVYGGVSLLVLRAKGLRRVGRRRRGLLVAAVIAGIAFTVYMSYNQGARIAAVGTGYKYEPNPIVERALGEQFARGLTVTALYPTHGYQGLAYNLQTPTGDWTQLRGSSRAFDSYLEQYGFGESVQDETYPARTEARTGWPADQLWATIYPWLASDLSWWGAALFMFGVGWWLARFWHEAVVEGRTLSLLLLCQLSVLIAFVPANNQLGIGRPSLICLVTLGILYLVNSPSSRRAKSTRAVPG